MGLISYWSEREKNLDIEGIDFRSFKMIVECLLHSKGCSEF